MKIEHDNFDNLVQWVSPTSRELFRLNEEINLLRFKWVQDRKKNAKINMIYDTILKFQSRSSYDAHLDLYSIVIVVITRYHAPLTFIFESSEDIKLPWFW